jgi:protease I
VNADDFDAVVVPGGFAPDRLRRYEEVLALVRGVFAKGGVVAAICHAGWVPISAGILRGKRATCVAAIKDDMTTRGALLRLPVVVMATW